MSAAVVEPVPLEGTGSFRDFFAGGDIEAPEQEELDESEDAGDDEEDEDAERLRDRLGFDDGVCPTREPVVRLAELPPATEPAFDVPMLTVSDLLPFDLFREAGGLTSVVGLPSRGLIG